MIIMWQLRTLADFSLRVTWSLFFELGSCKDSLRYYFWCDLVARCCKSIWKSEMSILNSFSHFIMTSLCCTRQMCVFTPVSLIWFSYQTGDQQSPWLIPTMKKRIFCSEHRWPGPRSMRLPGRGTNSSVITWCVSYCILVHHGINCLLHFNWLVFLCWHELEARWVEGCESLFITGILGKLYLAHTWTTWKHPYLQKPWVSTDAAQCIIDNRAEWEFMVIKVYTSDAVPDDCCINLMNFQYTDLALFWCFFFPSLRVSGFVCFCTVPSRLHTVDCCFYMFFFPAWLFVFSTSLLVGLSLGWFLCVLVAWLICCYDLNWSSGAAAFQSSPPMAAFEEWLWNSCYIYIVHQHATTLVAG